MVQGRVRRRENDHTKNTAEVEEAEGRSGYETQLGSSKEV
jgi:hypothetical protein